MGVTFNADEVFEMGIRIEENGEAFYKAGAKVVGDARAREVLLDLARKESEHAQTFRSLRSKLPKGAAQPTVFDPEGVGPAYLKAAADTHVFNMVKGVEEVLKGVKTAREVIRTALGFEKDSIVFFLSMKDLIPPKLGQSEVDRLIREEQMHIRDLAAVLAALP